ncbi:unnamed protein product [Rotaria sordida]|uniref:LamG-like jellyroll fold domain-containing protein n=1 Tax=Rotaria sordida TaxID=392033 RepID=A0A815HQK9_9BILA|nr:unnamed protein product [Rotaria sordida]
MTTDTQKRVYKSRLQFVDTKRPKSYRNLNNSSLIGFGSDISYTSSKQSQSAMKILNVKDLVEIPSKRSRRRGWLFAFGIGLSCLLITAITVSVPLAVLYFNQQTTTSTSITTNTTASTSTSTTVSTTTHLPTSCNATCNIVSRAALSSYTAVWTFENNLNDILNVYNGTGVNSPGYSTGYVGQALSLNDSQYVTTPFINFANSSFTVEAWIQPATLVTNGSDYAVFGECDLSGGTKDNCMHLILRNFNPYSIYMGFWADDLVSRTTLPASLAGTWLHVAFVYDFSIKQQNIYRNGYNDGQANLTGTPAAYVGTSGLVNIGASQTNNQFKGLIDHMFVSNQAKSACEILDGATLVAYFSFDSGSLQDSGPNYFTGTITSGVTTVSGYVNQALTFGASSTYFSVGDLVALGTSNKAFSFSLWVKPTAYTGVGTIVHVANGADGYTNGVSSWCVPFIGFDSSNRLVAQVWNGSAIPIVGSTLSLNVWTHIVETYSTTNGVILYVNGIQVGTTGAASYSASEVPDYVLLGYYGSSGFNCQTGSITAGQFTGAIDEFRIYSRELSLTDVCVLANQ